MPFRIRVSKYPPAPDAIDEASWRAMCDCARLEIDLDCASHFYEHIPGFSREMLEERLAEFDGGEYALALQAVIQFDENAELELVVDVSPLTSPLIHGRVQFAVGQGGFHAATLRSLQANRSVHRGEFDLMETGEFLWVYDCGSEPRRHVDRAIDDFLSSRPSRHIDILFLSHFDRDHICGTPRLLKDKTGATVDTIVIPFLDDVERMIAFARACTRAAGGRLDRFFQNLIVDPLETLRAFKPKRIIMFGSDEDGEPLTDPIDPEPRSREGEGFDWKLVPSEPESGKRVMCWPVADDSILVRDGAFAIGTHHDTVWRLIPYVRRSDPDRVRDFKLAVEVLLGWKKGSFATEMESKETRRKAVTKYRTQLSKAYEYAFGDKNLTSMSLYSGPYDNDGSVAYALMPIVEFLEPAKVGWMGTGDADLRCPADIGAFETYYNSVLGWVSTFVLPHHGSIENSDPDHLVSDAEDWVACADPIHPWEHPAQVLRDAVGKRRKAFHHVNSDKSNEFRELAVIGWLR